MKKVLSLLLLTFLVSACSSTNSAELRNPDVLTRADYLEVNYKMKPHIKKAQSSLPFIKQRYVKGLAEGDNLYVTLKLYEPDKSFELVEVLVDDWYNENLLGRISSQLFILQHYNTGDMIDFKEQDILDWYLVKANGGTEGGYVRKFLKGCGSVKQ